MPTLKLEFSAGQILTANALNLIMGALERLGNVTGDSVVQVRQDHDSIGVGIGDTGIGNLIWIKPTSVGADGYHYAWTEELPQHGGGFTTGLRSGTTTNNQASEFNGNATATLNVVYPAFIMSDGLPRFQSDNC